MYQRMMTTGDVLFPLSLLLFLIALARYAAWRAAAPLLAMGLGHRRVSAPRWLANVKPFHGLLLAAALLGACRHPATAAKPAEAPVAETPELDAVLATAMAGTRTPAIAVLVMRDGEVAGQAVRGVRRSDRADPARLDDVWLIGSNGKPMTATLIARLVDRGVLSWEAPLAQLLPELAPTMRPEYRSVTLIQLLSNRAGFARDLGDTALLEGFMADARALPQQRLVCAARAVTEAPAAAPGTEAVYSNTGFIVAAVVAERATGSSYEALMRSEVFEPLGIGSVGFGTTGDGQPRGHRGGAPVLDPPTRAEDGAPMMYAPAGYLHMSMRDWARFSLDQMAGSRGQGELLLPASYRLLQTSRYGDHDGLGWGVQDSIAGRAGPVLIHGGSDGNWLAWVVLFPELGAGVLVAANAGADMGAEQATHAVLAALFPGLSPPQS
jgi:CubicO group peptidase (beta-lactamase class C family)